MVLGTTSGAGKSWLATALCRWYAQRGFKVAPFKAQNMSNNARVVAGPPADPRLHAAWPKVAADSADGGEIGSAQYFQALAARTEPNPLMNPVLLKPEGDTRSQVVVLGRVRDDLSRMPWRGRSAWLWPAVDEALQALMATHDVVVIEGAGSPAEINLMDDDIVNLRVARAADARCLLVTDIDRGGAFAHLYGTHQLLPQQDQARIAGFVLNRFRGDASLLAPGPQQLQALTGVPTLGVLPMWREHGLPEEDGVFDEHGWDQGSPAVASVQGDSKRRRLRIAIIAYPLISNLDEFQALRHRPDVQLRWVRSALHPDGGDALAGADLVILPGSKQTAKDLRWLRSVGLDARLAAFAQAGGRVLGLCGGLQMLGEALIDPEGIDGNGPGLGLLPLVTCFARDKQVSRSTTQFAGDLDGPWACWQSAAVDGYQIRHGQTAARADLAAPITALPDGLGWQQGSCLGVYLHGVFENPLLVQRLIDDVLGVDASAAGDVRARPSATDLELVFDGLAAFVDQHLGADTLLSLIELTPVSPQAPPQ